MAQKNQDGLRIIKNAALIAQQTRANRKSLIPTKTVITPIRAAMTAQSCSMDIDRCQHFSHCGLCVDKSRIETSSTSRIVGFKTHEILDVVVYMEQYPNADMNY